MKLKEYLAQFDGMDPEATVLFTGDNTKSYQGGVHFHGTGLLTITHKKPFVAWIFRDPHSSTSAQWAYDSVMENTPRTSEQGVILP